MPSKLTPREQEMLCFAFQCQKDPNTFKVDNAKLAEMAGLANAKSASTTWSQLKKKLLAGSNDSGNGEDDNGAGDDVEATAEKSTKGKGKARKAKPTAKKQGGNATNSLEQYGLSDVEGADESDESPTPAPKAAANKKRVRTKQGTKGRKRSKKEGSLVNEEDSGSEVSHGDEDENDETGGELLSHDHPDAISSAYRQSQNAFHYGIRAPDRTSTLESELDKDGLFAEDASVV